MLNGLTAACARTAPTGTPCTVEVCRFHLLGHRAAEAASILQEGLEALDGLSPMETVEAVQHLQERVACEYPESDATASDVRWAAFDHLGTAGRYSANVLYSVWLRH